MSDRYTGTIAILKRDIERYPEIKRAVEDAFYWKGELNDDSNYDKNSPVADFIDGDARYGHFEDVEDACVRNHVPYDRWSAAYGGYDAETCYYRPDIDPDAEIEANGDGEFVYTERYLRRMIEGCNTHEEIGKTFLKFLNEIPKIRNLEEYGRSDSE